MEEYQREISTATAQRMFAGRVSENEVFFFLFSAHRYEYVEDRSQGTDMHVAV